MVVMVAVRMTATAGARVHEYHLNNLLNDDEDDDNNHNLKLVRLYSDPNHSHHN
jgi:hypothetical protein